MCSRIFRSSCSSRAYSPRDANQRESQVRLTPSLSPIGLTFCPISGLLDLAHDDGDLRERLQDARRAAAGARRACASSPDSCRHRPRRRQRVDIEVMVVLGIGDGDCSVFFTSLAMRLREKVRSASARSTFLPRISCATQVELLRADAHQRAHRPRLVVFERAFACRLAHDLLPSWPSCPRRGRSRSASARTRRTCGRSCPR